MKLSAGFSFTLSAPSAAPAPTESYVYPSKGKKQATPSVGEPDVVICVER